MSIEGQATKSRFHCVSVYNKLIIEVGRAETQYCREYAKKSIEKKGLGKQVQLSNNQLIIRTSVIDKTRNRNN